MKLLAQAGFNVVAASHSHRISGYARMKGFRKHEAFCFYGLGSLVSGYVSSPLEREGLVVTAGFNCDGKFARLQVRPVILAENGFGMIPDTAEAEQILQRFRELSNDVADGSYERKFYQDVSHGLLKLYLRDARAAFRFQRNSRIGKQDGPCSTSARETVSPQSDWLRGCFARARSHFSQRSPLFLFIVRRFCNRWGLYDFNGPLKIHVRM